VDRAVLGESFEIQPQVAKLAPENERLAGDDGSGRHRRAGSEGLSLLLGRARLNPPKSIATFEYLSVVEL